MIDISGTRQFHGHFCPGLALGIRAAEVALREIGPHSSDEEVVAIVETDNCSVDAIQYLTGCTFGKGNLIHLDYGKNAFTFIRRSDGKAIRIVVRPNAAGEPDPEYTAVSQRLNSGQAEPGDAERFTELHEQRGQQVLDAPEADLLDVRVVATPLPAQARIFRSLVCEECGESTMETRTRQFHGRVLCIPCFRALEKRM